MQRSKRVMRGASPPAETRSFEDVVCETWAHTHDATAAVVRGPAPGIALRLRGGHQAVLALPGWAARGPACAADDDGVELCLLDGASSQLLLHCRALLCDDVAVLLDARDGAADDAPARWVRAASERLAGQLPGRGDALARLIVVLDALWDASERETLDKLFAAAADAAAAVAARAAAERAVQRAAAEVGRVSGEQMMEVLRTVLRHALDTFTTVDILACRATCVPWCRAASDPACFARLTLPAGSEAPRLRAWLRLAAGDCSTWARELAEHAAHTTVPAKHAPVVFAGTQLDLTSCESIEYAELLREAQRAAAVLTSLRLHRLEVTGLPRPAPGVLIPAQLRSLLVAAPLLRDICVSRITMHRVHESTALAGALERWAQAEGAQAMLCLEELVIDATLLRGRLNPFAARQWLPRSVLRLTDSLFHTPQLEELMRRLPAATRVLLRLPHEVHAEVLEPAPPQNWEHLRQRATECGIRDFANLAQRCDDLRECVRQLCDDTRVTVQLVD